MSSSVGPGLQSCLEVVESRFLRLKLAPPRSNLTELEPMQYNEEQNITNTNNNGCKQIANQNIDIGGWNLLQSLYNTKVPTENEKVYVHPLVKRSASRLSDKSLEMCTERLGSETGSDVSDSSDDISLLSLDTKTVAVVCNVQSNKPRESSLTEKMNRSSSFPPPLTSISGSNYVRVKSHREGGRLVFQAVSFPHCDKFFHAERSEGRLTLSFFKDATSIFEDENVEEQEQQEEEDDDDEDFYEEVEVEEKVYGKTESQGNSGNVVDEFWTGKFPRRCICKQCGVATKAACLIGTLSWWLLKKAKILKNFNHPKSELELPLGRFFYNRSEKNCSGTNSKSNFNHNFISSEVFGHHTTYLVDCYWESLIS